MKSKAKYSLIVSLCLVSCANVQISKGKFQVTQSPQIEGDYAEIIQPINNRVKFGLNLGKNQTWQLKEQTNRAITPDDSYYNDPSYSLPESKAEISYRLIQTMPVLTWQRTYVNEQFLKSIELGVFPYPNIIARVGVNAPTVEFGVGTMVGISINPVDYKGTGVWDLSQLDGSWTEIGGVEMNEDWTLHSYCGIGAYGGFHKEKWGINLSTGYVLPWSLMNSLPSNEYHKPSFDPTNPFPGIFNFDVGASYNISGKTTLVCTIQKLIDENNYNYALSGRIEAIKKF